MTIMYTLMDYRRLVRTTTVNRNIRVDYPLTIKKTTILRPRAFLLESYILGVDAMTISNIRLLTNRRTISKMNDNIVRGKRPVILGINGALSNTILRMRVLVMMLTRSRLKAPSLMNELRLANALIMLYLNLLLNSKLPLTINILLNRRRTGKTMLRLRRNLTIVPLIGRLRRINETLTLINRVRITAINATTNACNSIINTIQTIRRKRRRVILNMVTRRFLSMPPNKGTRVTLYTLDRRLINVLARRLRIRRALNMPIIRMNSHLTMIILNTSGTTLTILLRGRVITRVIEPINRTRTYMRSILAPTPLIGTNKRKSNTTKYVAMSLNERVIILRNLRNNIRLIRHNKRYRPRLIRPTLISRKRLQGNRSTMVLIIASANDTRLLNDKRAMSTTITRNSDYASIKILIRSLNRIKRSLNISVKNRIRRHTIYAMINSVMIKRTRARGNVQRLITYGTSIRLLTRKITRNLMVRFSTRIVYRLLRRLIIIMTKTRNELATRSVGTNLINIKKIQYDELFTTTTNERHRNEANGNAGLRRVTTESRLFRNYFSLSVVLYRILFIF